MRTGTMVQVWTDPFDRWDTPRFVTAKVFTGERQEERAKAYAAALPSGQAGTVVPVEIEHEG